MDLGDMVTEMLDMALNPGGDPDAIHSRAADYRAVSHAMHELLKELHPAAEDVTGTSTGAASAAFDDAWTDFHSHVTEYAVHLGDAAQQLDSVADFVHESQVQARNFKIMLGITVVTAVGLTFFTFGTSDVAGMAVMEAVTARMAALLAGEADAIAGLASSLATVAARFALGSGLSLVSASLAKGLSGTNPLDPASWSAKDLTNALLGGVLTAGMGAVAALPSISGLLAEHPVIGAGAAGILGGSSGSMIVQFWLNHASPLDVNTWVDIVESTAIAAGAGVVLGAAFSSVGRAAGRLPDPAGSRINGPADAHPPPPRPPLSFPNGTGLTGGDVVRAGTGVPAGAAQYAINVLGKDGNAASPALPPPPAQASPGPPSSPPALPPTSHPGGGSYTVQPDDTWWDITGRQLGDPTLWPLVRSANPQIPDATLLHPGDTVNVPQLPASEGQFHVHIAQDGDSVWSLARGNPDLMDKIARANNLADRRLIRVGEVLLIPNE